MRTWIILFWAVWMAGWCWAEAPAPDIELGVDENGALTLSARMGQVVRLRLAGNATTGYEWTLAGIAGSDGQAGGSVEIIGKIEYQPAPADGKLGVGGEFLAHIQAVKPGRATLTFHYRRPWEKTTPPIQTFAITIDVVEPEDQEGTKCALLGLFRRISYGMVETKSAALWATARMFSGQGIFRPAV